MLSQPVHDLYIGITLWLVYCLGHYIDLQYQYLHTCRLQVHTVSGAYRIKP